MNIRGIAVLPSEFHKDVLEVRANNHRPIAKKNLTRTTNVVRAAIKRENIESANVRKRGNSIYIVLSDEGEAAIPKRTRQGGRRKSHTLTKKIKMAREV